MAKQLILMRHAKSGWGDPQLADHERSLNDRGLRAAPKMARWLEQHFTVPELILTSTARRVQETVQGMLDQWPARRPQVLQTRRLYLASPETLLSVIRSDAMGVDSLMVVGHNPGLEALVGQLADRPERFPTAAIAVFAVRVDDWSRLSFGCPCECLAVARPKELGDAV